MNVEQELDTTLLADLNSILNYQAQKFPNREELTGKEEADRLHDLGGKVAGTLTFPRAQPQHFAFLLAYGLGAVETAPAGASGFRHTIRPLAGEVDAARSNPSFTVRISQIGFPVSRFSYSSTQILVEARLQRFQ